MTLLALLGRLRTGAGGGEAGWLDHAFALGRRARVPDGPRPVLSVRTEAPDAALAAALAEAPGLAEAVPPGAAPAGAWVLAPRPGERLAPGALPAIAAALLAPEAAGAAAAYTDTVRLDAAGRIVAIEAKPAPDPLLDRARPYMGEFLIRRRGADPAAPPDLHIPYPACLTLRPAEMRPFAPPAPVPLPAVSVVIPTRDRPDLLGTVLAGLLGETDYPGLEVIVVDNGSTDPGVPALLARHAGRTGFHVLPHPGPFSFSAMVNRGAAAAAGDAILLLNNDIAVREPGWLRELAACLALPGTGIAGARLLFPDGRLQHAGTVLGLGQGHAGHWHAGAPAESPGPLGRLRHRGHMSAVTGACMLVRREVWEALGGFDERDFAVAYNDVDFCLRAARAGWATVWTPFATLVHAESATRRRRTAAERARFRAEKAALRARHGTDRVTDPVLSPWDSRELRPRRLRLPALPPPRRWTVLG